MKRKITLLTALFFIVFNLKTYAQSYKSEVLSFYNFVYPESYIPEGYHSYGVKLHLSPDLIVVFVDGEKKGTRPPLSYNEFFKEKDLKRAIIGTDTEPDMKGYHIPTLMELGYTLNDKEAKDHFILDISIKNIAYTSNISETKNVDPPFSSVIYYRYDAVYKIINSMTKEVVMEKTYNVKEQTNNSPLGKTKAELVSYLTENIDKDLLFNQLVKNIQENMRGRLVSWIDVEYYQDSFYFSRISKEDKNPIFAKLNQDVDVLEKWSKNKAEPTIDEALLSANAEFIQKNNLVLKDESSRFQDETRLKNYKNYLNKKKVFTDFILKMDQYSKELDQNDKGQKAALWACYINIASSFQVLNNSKSSLEYLQKAYTLKYQEGKVKNVEDEVKAKETKMNVFFANGEIKKDVNSQYFKYLTL
ncbi:hypothetical protein [Flavobacterium chungbukense]|uniref:Tetratricopeptide repeat protein n=1 Tax=Flavobacterium chungbukense TaxID=877464 RepID=A0ABP7XJA6_9FLAO|nr:hypothetical protein [Flavobacterium chungbukense]MCC4923074.1 hypothetical protein [Flavobacterium chungbukense]